MKLAVMQPYFFPYLPYWQLMNAVDKYIIYDDVNFINRGWINRNRILINGKPTFFNLQVIGASQNKLINEVSCGIDDVKRRKMLTTLKLAYKKAPQFNVVMPLMEKIISYESEKIVPFLVNSFFIINDYLKIDTEIILSSTIPKDNSLKGHDKLLAICKYFDAQEYCNAIGGVDIYSAEDFQNVGIALKFLKSNPVKYRQFSNEFQADLSIIDVLMFNSREKVIEMLDDFIFL